MAKKKTTKATAKKKAAAKSTEEKKKSSAKKTSAKKSSASKKSTAKKTSNANNTKQAKTKKAASVKKPNVTRKELLSRKFNKPDNIVVESAPTGNAFDAIPDAPPFFDTDNQKELKRLKGLLMQKIDMTNIPPPRPKAKKKIPIAKLIKRQYAVPTKTLWTLPKKDVYYPDPPPYFETSDPEQKAKIRSLMMQKISLKDVTPQPEPKTPTPKPAIPISELIHKVFFPWVQQDVDPPPLPSHPKMSDPPFFDGTPEEMSRIRELLFKQFDLTDIPEPVQKADQQLPQPENNDIEGVSAHTDTLSPKTTDTDAHTKTIEPETSAIKTTDTPADTKPAEPEPPAEKPAEPDIPKAPDYPNDTLETNNKETQLMSNSLKCVFAGVLAIFVLLYIASGSNHSKYYLIDGKSGVEVWQGNFSPMGKSRVITMMGMDIPETTQESYTRFEIYPMICEFYIDQANDVMSEDNIPNLVQVREYLEMAHYYATEEVQQKIQARLNGIDFMVFILKADMAIQKGSENDLDKARAFIEEANELVEKNYQKDLIKSRLQLLEKKSAEIISNDQQATPIDDNTSTQKHSHSQQKAADH